VKVLLDTNVYADLRRGDPAVADLVRRAERVLMSAVVVGELLYGFRHGGRFEWDHQRLQKFLDLPEVEFLPVTYATADRFGRIFAALRHAGRPIPSNDIWIAAHALESGADLLSFDRHFDAVEGLVWVRPGN
jgi:predicted nucleic acid-binding protein